MPCLFGVNDAYLDEGNELVTWLSRHRLLDVVTAFRRISGEGTLLDEPSLPSRINGTLPSEPNAMHSPMALLSILPYQRLAWPRLLCGTQGGSTSSRYWRFYTQYTDLGPLERQVWSYWAI